MTHADSAQRRIVLRGAVNVRDLGGLAAADGRKIRPGLVFRSDALTRLTDADLDIVSGLGLRTVVDLRSEPERDHGPDRLPPGARAVPLPVDAGQVTGLAAALLSGNPIQAGDLPDGPALLTGLHRRYVSDPELRGQFARALAVIAAPGTRPVLFHCTAGKDRTGWLAAILLTALGVPRDQVLADYMASNDYYWPAARRWLAQRADPELLRPLMTQRPGYLEAAFEEAAARYGSFPAFLDAGLGLGPGALARLREGLLS